MNIKIHYSRGGFEEIKKLIDIKIVMQSNQNIVFEQEFVIENSGVLEFFCDYPPTEVNCHLQCNDLDIFHHPMIIESLEFDNFYQLKTFAHHSTNHYDVQFVEYAKQNNLMFDDTGFNNCMFFTGQLTYRWSRPITTMILHPPKTVFTNPT